MDHHCPWTGNCVGLKTHKYFICFCFWTIIACLHVFVSTPFVNPKLSFNFVNNDFKWCESFKPFNPATAHVMSMAVPIGVSILFCMHWGFLKNNHTSVESGYLMMYSNPYKMEDSDSNVKQILGPDSSEWLWPRIPGETYTDKEGKILENSHYLNGLVYPRN